MLERTWYVYLRCDEERTISVRDSIRFDHCPFNSDLVIILMSYKAEHMENYQVYSHTI